MFGCFPPHPTTCCVTITHLSVSHSRPTASPTASHHRGAASPTRKPRLTVTRDDQVSGHHLNPHPRTLNKPTPAPHKSSTSRQPRRPQRPRRRPAGATTPVNTQKSSTSDHQNDLDDGQHTRPHPRTCSNIQMSRTIDPNHGQQHDPILGQQAHPYPRTLEKPAPSTPTTATRRPPVDHEPTTTHQAPIQWRSTLRRSRTGNAKARGREQVTRQTNPRPTTTPTTSNTNEAHAISNGSGHQDNPHHGQQPHPQRRTLLWNTQSTPTTTTGRQLDDPHLGQQSCPRRRTLV